MIGEMRYRIGIYTVTETADTNFGGVAEDNTLTKTLWASMIPGGGSEEKEAGKITATNQVTWRIRKTALTEKQKIKYGLVWYNILRIDEEKRYLNVLAEKKV